MTAENLYNGEEASGCVFSFWLPCVEAAAKTNTESQLITKDTR
jgi:hypothetical protein